jgi:uncharacterized protein YktB (UPF0637 family)
MYLYLGQNVVVYEDSVIGIFDLDNTTASQITRNFLNNAESNASVITVSEELPKSFVLCDDGDKLQVYLAQLTSTTLAQRAEKIKRTKMVF